MAWDEHSLVFIEQNSQDKRSMDTWSREGDADPGDLDLEPTSGPRGAVHRHSEQVGRRPAVPVLG